MGIFFMNIRFWLLLVELRKTITLSSLTLNFLQRYSKYQIGSCPKVLYVQESIFTKKNGFSKAMGGLSPPYLVIDKFECSVHIYRGPWPIMKHGWVKNRSFIEKYALKYKLHYLQWHLRIGWRLLSPSIVEYH